MPGWDFDEGRNASPFCHAQCLQAVARPAMEEIITTRLKIARSNPIEILFLGPVIIWAIDERNEPDGMPAQRIDVPGRDFALTIIVGDGAAEEAAAIRSPQR